MRNWPFMAFAITLIACEKPAPTAAERAQSEIDRGMEIAKRYEQERRDQDDQDRRNAPFDSALKIELLSAADKKRLCGDDYGRVAVGWPIKKALTCSGRGVPFSLTSESAGGLRIWQSCEYQGECLTIGEASGLVSTWNR